MDWAVATTAPSCEKKASADLVTVGFSTYYPRYESVEAIHGRIIKRARPLFPGYLFFELMGDLWRRARASSEHVLGVLMWSEETPAALPQIVVDELRERAGPDDVIRAEKKKHHKFRVGQTVRMKQGSFAGFFGLVEHMSSADRVTVLFDMFGRKTPVTIAETELAA